MRVFYVSLLSMFCGIFIRFSASPLQFAMQNTTSVSKNGVFLSATFSMIGSTVARLSVGVACDLYGAKLPMVGLLLLVSITTGLTAVVKEDVALTIFRFVTGCGG